MTDKPRRWTTGPQAMADAQQRVEDRHDRQEAEARRARAVELAAIIFKKDQATGDDPVACAWCGTLADPDDVLTDLGGRPVCPSCRTTDRWQSFSHHDMAERQAAAQRYAQAHADAVHSHAKERQRFLEANFVEVRPGEPIVYADLTFADLTRRALAADDD